MAKQIDDDQPLNPFKISIRPYRPSDVDDFMTYYGDKKVTQFTRMDNFNSQDEASLFIKNSCIPHPYCRSICYDDRSIGYISITPGSGNDHCRAEVGYALCAKYWGQGIVFKTVKMAICEFLAEFPFVVRLQAHTAMNNIGSQRVLQKLGFCKEGVLRNWTNHKGQVQDIAMFSIVSADSNLIQCYK